MEAGYDRVRELLTLQAGNETELKISAVQWGEIACKLFNRHSRAQAEHILSQLSSLGLTIEPATAERAVLAATLKASTKIAYADAFCAQVALDSPLHTLVTADYGFKPVEHLMKIEFLPAK